VQPQPKPTLPAERPAPRGNREEKGVREEKGRGRPTPEKKEDDKEKKPPRVGH
jgi:hypothetical protein